MSRPGSESSVAMSMTPTYAGAHNLDIMSEARRYNAHLLSCVEERARPGDRLVDFGAGPGTFAIALAERQHRVVAVEIDPAFRRRLAERGVPAHERLEALDADSVDFLYTLNVLEHIGDDAAALAAMRRVLRPGGRLLVYVPAFPCLWTSMDTLIGHKRRYRREALRQLVAGAGFMVTRCHYVDPIGFVAGLWLKARDDGRDTLDPTLVRLYDRWLFPLSRRLAPLTGRWFGRSLLLLARKPPAPSARERSS